MFLSADDYLVNVKSLLAESTAVDIAVAFWGRGAEPLIPQKGRKLRILCNLGMGGTNPEVIRTLRTYPSVEIKNLDRLHAKVMIGDQQAIIGSANCSANGLNFEGEELAGWHEAGYRVSAQDQLKQMQAWFDQRWAEGEIITDQMLDDAARIWEQRSGIRRVDLRQSRQLLQMPLEVLERRDVAVLVWRTRISKQAEQLLEAKKSNAATPVLSKAWRAYEDWFDDLHVGMTVIDIYIGERGGVEVCGLFEIVDGLKCSHDESGDEMSLHISRKVETLFDIPEAELLKGLKEQVKKHWRELFVKDGDDVAQVLPLSEFVKALRSV